VGGVDLRKALGWAVCVAIVFVSAALFAVVNELQLVAVLCLCTALCVLICGLFVDFDKLAGGDRA
jgi:hypothetical protein